MSFARAGPPMARDCGSWPLTDFTSRWATGPATARSACSSRRPGWPTSSTSRGPAGQLRDPQLLDIGGSGVTEHAALRSAEHRGEEDLHTICTHSASVLHTREFRCYDKGLA